MMGDGCGGWWERVVGVGRVRCCEVLEVFEGFHQGCVWTYLRSEWWFVTASVDSSVTDTLSLPHLRYLTRGV